MKITKNTSVYTTTYLRSVVCAVHNLLKKTEGPLKTWKRLEVQFGGTDKGYCTGHAYLHGRYTKIGIPNGDWGRETAPRRCRHKDGRLIDAVGTVYHEFMHLYGYHHGVGGDATKEEIHQLIESLPEPKLKQKPKAKDPVSERYKRMLARQKKWASTEKRAKSALAKVAKEIRTYEKRHAPSRLAGEAS